MISRDLKCIGALTKRHCPTAIRSALRGLMTSIRSDSRVAWALVTLAFAAMPAARAQGVQSDYLHHEIAPGWDATRPHGKTPVIDFTTSEGTWMSVDTSPDGAWLVFDLLGQIYRMPASGGEAQCLTQDSGIALNYHPRISPDGKRIAFISDRSGQANLWIMNADGSVARPLFLDPVSRMMSPAWMPDGSAILAVREFPTYSMHRRSARIWRFPVNHPADAPEELVGGKSGFQAYWPSPTPDGKSFYFMWTTFAGPLTGDVKHQHLRRYDFATHAQSLLTQPFPDRPYYPGVNADLAPEVSPDGKFVAFARRLLGGSINYRGHQYDERTALWLRDLATGHERVLIDPITLDMQGAHGMKNLTVLPSYSWAKDSKSLVMWNNGKLRRIDLTGATEDIPFVAHVHRLISEQVRWNHGIGTDTLHSHNIRWPTVSEPFNELVFEAVGQLWKAPASGAQVKATPLVPWTPSDAYYMPAVSPDGRRVAFVSWNDYEGGDVLTCELTACVPKAVGRHRGMYLYPTWSATGTLYALHAKHTNPGKIAREGGRRQSFELIELDPHANSERIVRESFGSGPIALGPAGRIYSLSVSGAVDTQTYLEEGKTLPVQLSNLSSIDPAATSAARPENTFPRATGAAPSSNGEYVAFVEGDEAYVAPMTKSTAEYAHGEENYWQGPQRPFAIVKENPADHAVRISTGGANTLRWLDAHHVIYALGDQVHIYDVVSHRDRAITVDASLPKSLPDATETVILTGARIITLGPAGVIEKGSIVVKGSRILCVGNCSSAGVSRTIDVTGKTITAGFTDVHAHGGWPDFPVYPQHYPPASLYLAYGVTTTLDPAVESQGVFPMAELIEAGRMVGPRAYSTGDPINACCSPDTGPQSYADAEAIVRRIAEQGGHSIKIFLTPRRDQRQMLAEAARKYGLSVTNEGQDLRYDLGATMDGDTGWEHMLHYVAIYQDAIQFFARAKVVYSPTLVVAGAGLWSEEYWQARTDYLHDPKLRRFLPWPELLTRLGAPLRPKTEYPFPLHAEAIRDLRHAGGFASLGGHGEQWGLDTHWEMWNYAEAQTPMEVLTMASQGGAQMMGLEHEIGSLEVGKTADLVVLNINPLEDIHATTNIALVMKGGVLYDANTLDEIWPSAHAYGTPPWAGEEPYANPTTSSPASRAP